METPTNNETTETAPQWAIVELMGHVRTGGLICKDNMFGTAMLRLDVPQADGTFVSQLVNPQSIYRITFSAEALARAAAKSNAAAPLQSWELTHLLPRASEPPHPSAFLDPDDDDHNDDQA